MSNPIVSRLWIAAADRAVDEAGFPLSGDEARTIRERLSIAAIDVEQLMDIVADGSRSERLQAVATLTRRFGPHVREVDQVGARAIGEAVTEACADLRIPGVAAERLAHSCSAAVLDAARALDAVFGC